MKTTDYPEALNLAKLNGKAYRLEREAAFFIRCGYSSEELVVVEYEDGKIQVRPREGEE